MSEDKLCTLIEDAFSDASKPAFGDISIPTYDDEDTNSYFGRTDWKTHNISSLKAHESSLGFFKPEAFRYYLPAFVVASIRHPELADVIPQRIVTELQKAYFSRNQRWLTLSQDERAALARFVEWWRDRIHPHCEPYRMEPHERVELTKLVQALDNVED